MELTKNTCDKVVTEEVMSYQPYSYPQFKPNLALLYIFSSLLHVPTKNIPAEMPLELKRQYIARDGNGYQQSYTVVRTIQMDHKTCCFLRDLDVWKLL